MNGAGKVIASPLERLGANITGGGTVDYYAAPLLETDVKGPGSVNRLRDTSPCDAAIFNRD